MNSLLEPEYLVPQIEILSQQRNTLLSMDRSQIYRGNKQPDIKAIMDGLEEQCTVRLHFHWSYSLWLI